MTDLKPIDYVYGTFQNEIKNRFLCSVNIDGKDVICYIPSSCRLSNFIDMTGRTVLLRPIEASNARTPYAVYAVKYRKSFILLNLAQTNRVIEAQIQRRYFSFWVQEKRFPMNIRLKIIKQICLFTIQTHSLRLKVPCHFPKSLFFQQYTPKEP